MNQNDDITKYIGFGFCDFGMCGVPLFYMALVLATATCTNMSVHTCCINLFTLISLHCTSLAEPGEGTDIASQNSLHNKFSKLSQLTSQWYSLSR